MSEFIERIGNAIHAADKASLYSSNYDAMAKASVEAMRKATTEMCRDGADATDGLTSFGARNVWEAMIDAALK